VATHYKKGCKNPRLSVGLATKFLIVAPDVCGSLVWTLLHVTVFASIFFRYLVGFQNNLCTHAIRYKH
jgi:hypothetical protein